MPALSGNRNPDSRMLALAQPFWDAKAKSLDVAQKSVNPRCQNRIKAVRQKALSPLLMCRRTAGGL